MSTAVEANAVQQPVPPRPELVRVMGRWALTLLVINCTIGIGIFRLPSRVAALIGDAAPWGYLLAGLVVAVWVAVLAELASQFPDSGGQYLYVRTALGRFAGLQCGWFSWLTRLAAQAAILNVLVDYLGRLWPGIDFVTRAGIIMAIVVGLTWLNYRGVRGGVWFSNTITAAKLGTLALFIIAGLALAPTVAAMPAAGAATAASLSDWGKALVILIYAFSGFESAPTSMGEAREPRRDAPFALYAGMGIVAVCYLLAHFVCMRTVPDLARSDLPFADAVESFGGASAAKVIAVGVMLSAFGTVAAAFITAPRLMFALAERGDFPAVLAAVHVRFRTPHVSLLLWAVMLFLLALPGGFLWSAILSVAARLITYALMCVALIQLRRRHPEADAWRAPGGRVLAVLGVLCCVALGANFELDHLLIIAGVGTIAALNWAVVRGKPGSQPG
jgi:basic amino acid/polyamine antiporter, APA family